MFILGYDSAVENLGVCCVEIDDQLDDKIEPVLKKLLQVLKGTSKKDKKSKDEFYNVLLSNLKKLNEFYSKAIRIHFANVFDLIPGEKPDTKFMQYTSRLKKVLNVVDSHCPKVDVVLIEYQMKINSTTPFMASQIAYHYSSLHDGPMIYHTHDKAKRMSKPKGTICYGVDFNKNESLDLKTIESKTNTIESKNNTIKSTINSTPEIFVVGPTLKNMYKIAPDGDYQNFIVEYNNYNANKAHSEYNYLYFVKMMEDQLQDFNIQTFLKNKKSRVRNKTKFKVDDIADAFMMCYGWYVENYAKYN